MPRIADADFISAFNFAASTPYGDTSQSMWRVIDCLDVVTTVPTGLADIEENRAMLPRTSLLNCTSRHVLSLGHQVIQLLMIINYGIRVLNPSDGHFGTAGIQLTGSSKRRGWKTQAGSFRGGSTMKIVQSKIPSTASPVQPRLVPVMMNVFKQKVDPTAVLRWTLSLIAPVNNHCGFILN
jgi:hypothetical protein